MLTSLCSIDKDTVTPHRPHDRDTCLEDEVAEVLHLSDPRTNVVIGGHHFPDAPRQCLHIPAGHPTVGVQALERDQHRPGLTGDVRIAHRPEAAEVYEGGLVRRDRGTMR